MTPDDIRQQIELKIVELIKAKLADGTMGEERSQQISQMVLDALRPGMSWSELYRAIPKLDDAAPELSPVILPYLREYEERVAKSAEESVRQLIRQGQYDAAVGLVDRVIKQEVDLVWEGSGRS